MGLTAEEMSPRGIDARDNQVRSNMSLVAEEVLF